VKRIGIFGATGYAGHELVKILSRHGGVEIVAPNSESSPGKKVRDLYPDFDGDLVYTGHTVEAMNRLGLDCIFLATPEGFAKKTVPLLTAPKLIDLSHDYRASDEAVYGLPEFNRHRIRKVRLVANPGCYVTSCLLAAFPLAKAGLIERVVFDCKSGFSGAGRAPVYVNDPKHYADNVIPYKITQHRHKGEIERQLGRKVSFTPHVVPFFRGILTTMHVWLTEDTPPEQLTALYRKTYAEEPFVRVLDRLPEVRDARNTNLCCLGGFEVDDSRRAVVLSAIDNLVKGAAGQAVQNMNLMLGFPETQGLG
jgi:N-acetyl-gamma-glutamyl-phosphate reductase